MSGIEDKKPILSICIPTYNRSEYLSESFKILSEQVGNYVEDIEIIVSDNCSTDNTNEVICSFIDNGLLKITYNKNEENIGGWKNIEKVVSLSSGKYVFVMGDDDLLSPDFFDIIMKYLKKYEDIGIIHWNRLTGDINCSNTFIKDSNYTMMEQKLSPKQFIFDKLDKFNFISSLIFNRKVWDRGASYVKHDEYMGYTWYAQIIFGSLLCGLTCFYYYLPLVIQRIGVQTWSKFWPRYLICSMSNVFYDVDSLLPGIYQRWRDRLNERAYDAIPCVAYHRDYYRNSSIRKCMLKHLTFKKKCSLYFFLIPGSSILFRIKNKIISLVNRALHC